MTYDEAIKACVEGKPVMRQHWHWISLRFNPEKPRFELDREDDPTITYRSTKEDRKATDWMLYR